MDTIKIDGKQHPVKFSLSVVQKFAVKNGMESAEEFDAWYQEIQKKGLTAIGQIAELLQMGFERGAVKMNIKNEITADDIMDLVLDDPEQFAELQNIMQKSLESGIPNKPIDAEGDNTAPKK